MHSDPDAREPTPTPQEVAIVDAAIHEYQHAEAVVQARLYNFLFAESILLLSWSTVFSSQATGAAATIVLSVLSLLATVLGLAWALLGHRHALFHRLHEHIVESQESRLPQSWRIHEKITQLQRNGSVAVSPSLSLAMRPAHSWLGERNLGWLAPLAMALAAAALFVVAATR